ncbi:unnamed protein product [Bursaphelenchus xylophilus]|uniref:(pine wood nematode) hypothetical protein n=1 Tax=Bursaphelenchus xylophilus TaxID=6326 RepID=A0A1I7SE65_BURXY|nr:unnamed protein product [Bursaphelenchus xylophilus]CAG9088574.1 unnamed protein product [Bursaphelenchus xylophilus]
MMGSNQARPIEEGEGRVEQENVEIGLVEQENVEMGLVEQENVVIGQVDQQGNEEDGGVNQERNVQVDGAVVKPELEEQLVRMEEEDREPDADDGRVHRNIIDKQHIRLAEYQLRIEERKQEISEYLEVIRELEGTVGSLQARLEDLEERIQVMANAPMLMTGLTVFTKSTMDTMT